MNTEDQRPLAGLLLIDKELGATSMDICRVVRRRLVAGGAPKRVKVGHGGTLDPLATGLVVVLVGRATKLVERVMEGAKRYTTEIDLAHTSPSFDLETPPGLVKIDTRPTDEQVRAACDRFVGRFDQVPPIYSAVSVGGVRAYTSARSGDAIELKARPVRIDSIDVLDYLWPTLTLDVRCGKGVYIRSLARDLGHALGTGGMLTGLRRTAVAPFRIEHAVTLDDLPDVLRQQDLMAPDAD